MNTHTTIKEKEITNLKERGYKRGTGGGKRRVK